MEQQEMERQHQMDKRLEQNKLELEQEREKQKMEAEARKKLREMAFEAEQCEFQARLEEENEGLNPSSFQNAAEALPPAATVNVRAESADKRNGSYKQRQPTPNDASRTARWVSDQALQIERSREMKTVDMRAGSADKRNISYGEVQPTPNDASRTARWPSDQTPRTERSRDGTGSRHTWIDAVEARAQETDNAMAGKGAIPCQLPRLTLEKFDGDPLHWPKWIALFKALVHDRRELSDAERMTYLQSSLTGQAQDAICGLLCDGSLYGEALRELQCQFGSRATVIQASLRRVMDLPAVRNNDIPRLTEMSRALHSTVSVLKSLHYDADLAASTNVTAIVAKLPTSLAWKWGERLQSTEHREPTIADLDK